MERIIQDDLELVPADLKPVEVPNAEDVSAALARLDWIVDGDDSIKECVENHRDLTELGTSLLCSLDTRTRNGKDFIAAVDVLKTLLEPIKDYIDIRCEIYGNHPFMFIAPKGKIRSFEHILYAARNITDPNSIKDTDRINVELPVIHFHIDTVDFRGKFASNKVFGNDQILMGRGVVDMKGEAMAVIQTVYMQVMEGKTNWSVAISSDEELAGFYGGLKVMRLIKSPLIIDAEPLPMADVFATSIAPVIMFKAIIDPNVKSHDIEQCLWDAGINPDAMFFTKEGSFINIHFVNNGDNETIDRLNQKLNSLSPQHYIFIDAIPRPGYRAQVSQNYKWAFEEAIKTYGGKPYIFPIINKPAITTANLIGNYEVQINCNYQTLSTVAFADMPNQPVVIQGPFEGLRHSEMEYTYRADLQIQPYYLTSVLNSTLLEQ